MGTYPSHVVSCSFISDHIKDRRPITPPPCVKLSITDVATGKEVDVK